MAKSNYNHGGGQRHGNRQSHSQHQKATTPTRSYFDHIILETIPSEELDSQTEKFVKDKVKGLKPHQIRNFYSAVLQLKNEIETVGMELLLDQKKQEALKKEEETLLYKRIEPYIYKIKVLLAFNAARNTGNDQLKILMDLLIEKLAKAEMTRKRPALYSFLTICESIVAYHKFYTN